MEKSGICFVGVRKPHTFTFLSWWEQVDYKTSVESEQADELKHFLTLVESYLKNSQTYVCLKIPLQPFWYQQEVVNFHTIIYSEQTEAQTSFLVLVASYLEEVQTYVCLMIFFLFFYSQQAEVDSLIFFVNEYTTQVVFFCSPLMSP